LKLKLRVLPGGRTEREATEVEEPPSIIPIIEHRAVHDRMERKGFFRPSALFGCDRQNVFYYKLVREEPANIDNRLRRVLDNGTAVHSLIQDEYLSVHPDYWFVKEPKVWLKVRGAWIRGSCDGVLIRRKDMYRWGVEIKSITHDEFMRLTKPKEDHVFQASVYMNMQKLPFITIIYWDKDKQHLKEYHVKRKKAVWSEVEDRVEYLHSFVESGKLPRYDKATCNKTFCRYVKTCRKHGAPV
jgi:hypothetical protein